MKELRYKGGHLAVVVPATGTTVARGETGKFPDDVADSLLEQEENWELAKDASPAKKQADVKSAPAKGAE